MTSYKNLLFIACIQRYLIVTPYEADVDNPKVMSCYVQPVILFATTIAVTNNFHLSEDFFQHSNSDSQ